MPNSGPSAGGDRLPANLTMRTIVETHAILLGLIDHEDAPQLSLPAEAVIDLSFLQLVESARLHAAESGKELTLSEPASGALLETLRRGGFLEGMSDPDSKFWLHQGDMS